MGPRVCVIAPIAGAGESGVPRYAQKLIQGLDEVAPEFPELELSIVATPAAADRLVLRNLEASIPWLARRGVNRGPARILVEQVLAATQRADVVFFLDLNGPLLAPRRRFVTMVYDATAGRRLTDARWAYKRRLHPWAVRRAALILAATEFAKSEAVEVYGADPARVRVVGTGAGFELAGEPAPADESAGDGFLFVGNLGRNKNLPFLVRAYGQSAAEGSLLIVGRAGAERETIEREIARSPRQEKIKILDDVDDARLDDLYRRATAFVLPSLYEGLGFPPLEAAARGCPVLASDIPALRETLGDAALFAPPDNERLWASALERIARDEVLRSSLREKGLANLARYSWPEAARRVCAALNLVTH
jgi:glycosyltransferase involved in cell wall biosynthesis